MVTREDIQWNKDVLRKRFPDFYADVDKNSQKKGTPKSIRRHKAKSEALNNKMK